MLRKLFIRFLPLLLIIFLVTLVSAEPDYYIWKHNIYIELDDLGEANIRERFYISFIDESDKIEFREKSIEFGTDLKKWQELTPQFTNVIGGDIAVNKKISYNEREESYLELEYKLKEPLMAQGKETSLRKQYNLKVTLFNSLYQSGIWIIPENTNIIFELPPGAEIEGQIEPSARVTNVGSKKNIYWEGYKSGNKLSLNYLLWKKINPIIDLNKMNNFLFRTTEGLTILFAITIAIIMALIKRKKIIDKIERFVENSTSFENESN